MLGWRQGLTKTTSPAKKITRIARQGFDFGRFMCYSVTTKAVRGDSLLGGFGRYAVAVMLCPSRAMGAADRGIRDVVCEQAGGFEGVHFLGSMEEDRESG